MVLLAEQVTVRLDTTTEAKVWLPDKENGKLSRTFILVLQNGVHGIE